MSISEYHKQNLLDEFDSHAMEIEHLARQIYDLVSDYDDVYDRTDDIKDALSRMRDDIEDLETGPRKVWAVVDAKVHVEWDRDERHPTGTVHVHMEDGSPEAILDEDGDEVEMHDDQCSAWRNQNFHDWTATIIVE